MMLLSTHPHINWEMIWLAIGFIGQTLFFMRFLIQWLASEKKKESVIPTAFWYFSIGGGAILLAYAIYRQDPVFIAGQSLGVVIYLRNLYFIHGKPKEKTFKGNALIPELYCANLQESLNFYTQTLGFHARFSRPENNFAMLERQGAQIMLEQVDKNSSRCWMTGELEKPFGRGINFQIETTDVEKLYAAAQQSKAKIFVPLEEKWYRIDNKSAGNKQFVVQDIDGYLLRFYEDLGSLTQA